VTDNPLDGIELLKGLADYAKSVRTFFVALVDEGFSEVQALTLTGQWLVAMSTPRGESS
jgi:hypothetical protein